MARRPAKKGTSGTLRKSAGSPQRGKIVVAGDVFTDHHLYQGLREAPAQDDRRSLLECTEPGGAALLAGLLDELFRPARARAKKSRKIIHLSNQSDRHAYAWWSPQPKTNRDEDSKSRARFWRVALPMGYGGPATPSPEPKSDRSPATLPAKPSIVVLDDAGIGFRHQRETWRLLKKSRARPNWIVLKMARPLARGELWHELIPRLADSLVCVVSADELRQECASISHGLSWERTVEEVRDALQRTPEVAPLTRCQHLLVRFAADGALWVDYTARAEPKAKLIFDAGGIEGDWDEERDGSVVGSSTAFVSAIVHGLDRLTKASTERQRTKRMLTAIKSGLAAVRDLEQFGHGELGKKPPAGFPTERLAHVIRKGSTAFGEAVVDWPKPGKLLRADSSVWMIAEESQKWPGQGPQELRRPLMDLARQVVTHGVSALNAYPHARFGALVAIDRLEIEQLRSIRRLMIGYRDNTKAEKPLSIGVFGPPGAGKSFGVKQLSKEIFGGQAWLEFNLSQFDVAADLIGAFHQVRDKVLSGVTPVVFWDEFDSRELFWLQYLLAPMQDGRFQNLQLNHWIGKCVFVFAGGTSARYEDFPPPGSDKDYPAPDKIWTAFKLKKGPDFHSRLDGYYNVVGPNPRSLPPQGEWSPNPTLRPDPGDVCFPLRRALLIRSKLNCEPAEKLDFDSDLLDALLLTPRFEHGARSLEKLIAGLRPSGYGPIRRSELLAAPLRGMHVNERMFDDDVNRNSSFFMSASIEKLAETIHEMWLKKKIARPRFNKPYRKLRAIDQEDNRAAARRIPQLLSLVGLHIVGADSKEAIVPVKEATKFLKSDPRIERLAEAEHDGWMAQRIANGWRYGEERDDKKSIHNCLVPYSDLPANEKDKDREKVASFPRMIEKSGYRLAWMRPFNSDQFTPS